MTYEVYFEVESNKNVSPKEIQDAVKKVLDSQVFLNYKRLEVNYVGAH